MTQAFVVLRCRHAALRPYSFVHSVLQKHRRYQGHKLLICEIKEFTVLPTDLVLVHDRIDLISLQPTNRMPLTTFNERLTEFFARHSKLCTRDEVVVQAFSTVDENDIKPEHIGGS
ncbi:hypothetical protein N657DRAFT_4187 [Parathielavia appendiculata]|uniref:Tse2 ADP-ribosyltransferase toxin domain-containing protein n=1 Tax=Parathielavia appendiculata TaxID=2587402 RepID=A0AAN6U8J5_9PEZI|nr:hypothetical protein N657DRAFT_4187 [Parathielavia appendiculata]